MATSILNPPGDSFAMTSKRAPLAEVPNGANSPFRYTYASTGKRSRGQVGEQQTVYGQPPSKKQIIEIPDDDEDVENVDPRKRSGVPTSTLNKLDEAFPRRANNTQPTALERKFAAAAQNKKPVPSHRADPPQQKDNLDTVRQWKKHYKRQFPSFGFYFESVPEDVRVKASRQIQALGGREEKFFSKNVTHVVTTRPVPPELTSTSPDDDAKYDIPQPKTVQPSALTNDQRRTTDLLDATLQRRAQGHTAQLSRDADLRRPQPQTVDVLSRARDLGIKIWALEKLQRVLKTMFETDTGADVAEHDEKHHVIPSKISTKPTKDADLEQLLRNERITGPADRDMTVAAQDMLSFKGCYLYIHDMDEQTKPIMVRDYAKPTNKEDGKWPQFRVTGAGRCPFIEDPSHTKKLMQQEAQEAARLEREMAAQKKARGIPPTSSFPTRPLAEREGNIRRSPRKLAQATQTEMSKPLEPPKMIPAKRQSSAEGMPALFGSTQQHMRAMPRMIGGEPVASGLQHSNVTSAIRSQIISSAAISSTAAGMRGRVGDSKEVSALKRKVLERGASVTSNNSMPTSYVNDVRAAINNDDSNPPPRAAKRRAQETLGVLHEDEEEINDNVGPTHRRPPAPRKGKPRKPVKKEPKPGYCENCREKYDDFDDHCMSRKHRKFAVSQENYKELDELLKQLRRPHKYPDTTNYTAAMHSAAA